MCVALNTVSESSCKTYMDILIVLNEFRWNAVFFEEPIGLWLSRRLAVLLPVRRRRLVSEEGLLFVGPPNDRQTTP